MSCLSVNFARDIVPSRTSRIVATTPARAAVERSTVHTILLALVWLTFVASGLVFSEPAPVDALAMELIVALPVVGLTTTSPMLMVMLAGWLVCAAAATFSATQSQDIARSSIHTGVSLYLYLFTFVFAGFIAKRPKAHTELILSGSLVAAFAAAAAGIAGYLGAFPGAFDLFTRFGRATGTFKDPNVFGPFLVPALLYLLHLALNRSLGKAALSLMAAGMLALAVLLSFSRGAWFNFAVAAGLYLLLIFVTSQSQAMHKRLAGLVATCVMLLAVVGVGALQIDSVRDLLTQRASLTQSYDVGPEGRFGGQQKAVHLITDNVLGVGAAQFSGVYHHEEVHNVYLSMVLNAGWVGGVVYFAMVAATLILGAWRLTQPFEARPLLVIAYSAFVANALEGAIIDSDHWRHFYLLMAIVWGMLPVPGRDDREVEPAH